LPITLLKSKFRFSNPFQNVRVTNKEFWYNCGRIAAKIARFNNVNSEIIGWMLTKFVRDVARILPFNLLKTDLNWLPQQRPLGDRQTNIGRIITTNSPNKPVK